MIWYWENADKTKWLSVDKVSYWEFTSKETQTKNLPKQAKRMALPKEWIDSVLLVVIDGCERTFEGKEAEEIYQMLTTKQKELLKG